MTDNNTELTFSPIPLNFFDPSAIEGIPCRFVHSKNLVKGVPIKTLHVDCSSCQKMKTGLGEYACAYFIAQESLEDPNFRSLIINGQTLDVAYHSQMLERIRHLLKIYKRTKLEAVREYSTYSCETCHDYLSSLFLTLKIMIISNPGAIYKQREFYRDYAKTLCSPCGTNLTTFIDNFEKEMLKKDDQWCRKVDASSSFNIDYYSSIVEAKSTKSTILAKTSHLEVLSSKKVNGYEIEICNEPFSFTSDTTTQQQLSEMFPVDNKATYNRRQKIYVVNAEPPSHLRDIILNLHSHITTDSDFENILSFSMESNNSRKVLNDKINQFLPLVLKDLGIDKAALTDEDHVMIRNKVTENTIGWGIWEIFLNDDNINEIFAVAGQPVVIETYADGKCKTNIIPSDEEYNRFVQLLRMNLRGADFYNNVLEAVIDPEIHPIHFGRSRLTLFDSPLVDTKSFIIRKHRKMQLSGSEVIETGTMTPAMAGFCTGMKRRNKSKITYSGDVGSGKSTIQYIFDTKVPKDSTIITIGDIVEFNLAEMGFQTLTLYADRPNEEKIGQTRDTLMDRALRIKSDYDMFTEVLNPKDTASWYHTWVAGKSGTTTYHAANEKNMLIRCADELKNTGTSDPFSKMNVLQTLITSRRILSVEGYKYRVTDLSWVANGEQNGQATITPLKIFKWDAESDTHRFYSDSFREMYFSEKLKEDVLYSVDTVKHAEFVKEIALYEKIWQSFWNCIKIYKKLEINNEIALGNIPHFRREIEVFTNLFDAQVNMYKKLDSTDWNHLTMLGKRQIYEGLVETVNKLCPDKINDALLLIQKLENTNPASIFEQEDINLQKLPNENIQSEIKHQRREINV